jgi:hypothetical protein
MTNATSWVLASVFVCATAASTHAADGLAGTWSSGDAAADQTFVFRVQGETFIGIVCGPCDNPATVFRIADGRIVDGTRVTFSVVYDTAGPLFARLGPYRDHVSGALSGTRLTLQVGREGASETTNLLLDRVLGKRQRAATTGSATGMAPAASDIDGRWVAVGRVAPQQLTLKVRGSRVFGVICGPCDDPDGVFLVEDGTLDGNKISFYIHHIDAPVASVQASGPRRNFMKGTVSGNIIRFTWVREGKESEPGGEMVFTGPIR